MRVGVYLRNLNEVRLSLYGPGLPSRSMNLQAHSVGFGACPTKAWSLDILENNLISRAWSCLRLHNCHSCSVIIIQVQMNAQVLVGQ